MAISAVHSSMFPFASVCLRAEHERLVRSNTNKGSGERSNSWCLLYGTVLRALMGKFFIM